jgi:hypothetical protein
VVLVTAEPLEAVPDLTLPEAAARWGVASRNSIKARAAALGVELRRDEPIHTVWPAEAVALGDRLAKLLKQPGATLGNFPEALVSDSCRGCQWHHPGRPPGPQRSGGGAPPICPSVAPGAVVSDGALSALLQLAAAMAPPPQPAHPPGCARGWLAGPGPW